MRIENSELRLSATDLVNHLGCRVLTRYAFERATNPSPPGNARQSYGGGMDLIAQFGDEHEARCLDRLEQAGSTIAKIDTGPKWDQVEKATAATIDAMRSGVDVVFQATFIDTPWTGHADFLVRVDTPSALGDWSYEPVDAKLAQTEKVRALLQLGEYAAQIATVQQTHPENVHLWLGHDHRFTMATSRIAAFHRRARSRLSNDLDAPDLLAELYPDPCPQCSMCKWDSTCEKQRRTDDHLTFVANIRSTQIRRLRENGIETLADLAGARGGQRPRGMNEMTYNRLRTQARLQLHHRTTSEHTYEVLDPALRPEIGFGALPAPSPHDIFWDLEGNPFSEDGGIEYLWGITDRADEFTAIWAHDHREEKKAVEATIDRFITLRQQHPDAHIYHYAHHEETTLKRLTARYATRQEELNHLLRTDALVDLFQVVRGAVQCSTENYSLKSMERFYREGDGRDTEVTSGFQSIIQYEQWRHSGEQQLLDDIATYNKDDCVSTRELADWLAEVRSEAEAAFGEIVAPKDPETERSEEAIEREERVAELAEKLRKMMTADLEEIVLDFQAENKHKVDITDTEEEFDHHLTAADADDEALEDVDFEPKTFVELIPAVSAADALNFDDEDLAPWVLSGLLDFHRRDQNAEWWAYFSRLKMDDDELAEDSEAIAGLEFEGVVDTVAQSEIYRFRFDPDQPYKFKNGEQPHDPATEKQAGTIVALDPLEGTVDLKKRRPARGTTYEPPRALIPKIPVADYVLRDAIYDVAEDIATHGFDGTTYSAVADLLRRRAPRLRGGGLDQFADLGAGDRVVKAGADLDASYLPIQGPPGAGKTYNAARLVKRLVEDGCRVGVCANSHRVIENLLSAIARAGVTDIVKVGSEDPEIDGVVHTGVTKDAETAILGGRGGVTGGTAWFFSRQDLRQEFDVLLIDEAGQFSLANTVAVGSAARNLILVGDPQQLDQPTKGTHPPGVDRSALAHVLGDDATIRDTHGVFLDSTWRLHPDVCDFVSATSYENRLQPAPLCASRQIEGVDHGLWWRPVEHHDNASRSREEAKVVADMITGLLGRTITDENGNTRPLGAADVLVVAPYNAHVRELQSRVPKGVAVGTVDLFQGREAMVSILSLAASSARDASRGLGFVLDSRRFNVGVSRAQRLAVVVGNPGLADAVPGSIPQIPLVSDLCRFIEMAEHH